MKKKLKLAFRWIKRQWYKRWDHDGAIYVHRMYGKFYVRYPDGERSQNFSYRVAKGYAERFGGEVIEDF